jgi:hypothetical protein
MRQRAWAHDANAEHWGPGSFPERATFQMVGPCRAPNAAALGVADRTRVGGQTDASDKGMLRSSLDCRTP